MGEPMTNDQERKLENDTARLRRQETHWRALFDLALHADRAAVDIGLVALKTAILMNAGAVVALLAFVGQLWSQDANTTMAALLDSTKPFAWGLFLAAAAAGVAYFYQSFFTAEKWRDLAEESEGADKLKPYRWVPRFTNLTRIAMVALVGASYAFFLWGALAVIDVLPQ